MIKEMGCVEYEYYWTKFGDKVMRHLGIIENSEKNAFFDVLENFNYRKHIKYPIIAISALVLLLFFGWKFYPKISIPFIGEIAPDSQNKNSSEKSEKIENSTTTINIAKILILDSII